MERMRSFTVTVEIDTNKQTYKRTFTLDEHGDADEVLDFARQWANEHLADFS